MARKATAAKSTTMRHSQLVRALTDLREAAGFNRDQVAAELLCSPSKIAHIEQGRNGPSLRDTRDLLRLYGVDGERADALMELARTARRRGWWVDYSDVLGEQFHRFVSLEAEASVVRTVEVDLVPGLLQTADYARAVIEGASTYVPSDEVERRVEARVARQQRLLSDDGLLLSAVIDEGALLRHVGGRAVHYAQLEYLLALARRRNITVQVVPFAVGVHAAMCSPFNLLDFPDDLHPQVVYIENLDSRFLLDDPAGVARYEATFNDVRAVAASPDDSIVLIESASK